MTEQRTPQQRKALEVYCDMVADAMNDAGYDFRIVIKMPVRFTQEKVKQDMFKPIMRAMYPDKISTTELNTVQIQKVFEAMNLATAEKFGISMDWPNRFG